MSGIHALYAFSFHFLAIPKGMSLRLIINKYQALMLPSYIFRRSTSSSASSSVLTVLRGRTVWPNYEVVEFQASESYCLNPRFYHLLLCIFPSPYCFPNPRHSHHTGSSFHLGVLCLCPSIFVVHTRSFSHMGVSCLRPRYRLPTPTSSPLRLRSYYMPISPSILLLLLDSRESAMVDWSWFSVSSWRHHYFLLWPPPSYPFSLVHNSNKGRIPTHCAKVAWCCAYSSLGIHHFFVKNLIILLYLTVSLVLYFHSSNL